MTQQHDHGNDSQSHTHSNHAARSQASVDGASVDGASVDGASVGGASVGGASVDGASVGHASPPTTPPASGKKQADIAVSQKAIAAIHRQLAKRGTPEAALRVGIRGGGCSGFTYVIEFHDGPPRPKDRVYDYAYAADAGGTPQNVRVVVDPKSLIYLNGTVLEWEQTLMKQGFKFVNPNEKTSCGCGHSFTV